MPKDWRCIDMTGRRFGRLTVTGKAGKRATSQHALWWCKCDCGSVGRHRGDMLRTGETRSCGCLRAETSRAWGVSLHSVAALARGRDATARGADGRFVPRGAP